MGSKSVKPVLFRLWPGLESGEGQGSLPMKKLLHPSLLPVLLILFAGGKPRVEALSNFRGTVASIRYLGLCTHSAFSVLKKDIAKLRKSCNKRSKISRSATFAFSLSFFLSFFIYTAHAYPSRLDIIPRRCTNFPPYKAILSETKVRAFYHAPSSKTDVETNSRTNVGNFHNSSYLHS